MLLDANVLFPATLTTQLLSAKTRALLADEQNRLLVSYATLWEMLSKVHRGEVFRNQHAIAVSIQAVQELGVEFIPILKEDILAAVQLPDIHRDPFDRMLIAQAQRLGATIVSSDRKLHLYGIPVIPL